MVGFKKIFIVRFGTKKGNRLSLLLAVLHKHGGLQMADQDVFVNVVGGRVNQNRLLGVEQAGLLHRGV